MYNTDTVIVVTPEEAETIKQLRAELEHLQKKKTDILSEIRELEIKKKGSWQYLDFGILSLWDSKDDPLLEKEIADVREYKNGQNAQTFEDKLIRATQDQTVYFEHGDHKSFEPLEITDPKYDLVVNPGLVRIAQLITGESNQYFTSFASGTGTTQETPGDAALSAENWRVSLTTSGFIQAIGTAIKMQGKFPPYLNSAVISETGVFDTGAINTGTMLFRSVFRGNSKIEHTQNRTAYAAFQSIVQLSIT